MINAMLVTIHGFWSSPATWERLTAVWYADEQLRGLQIDPFGYPSPQGPGKVEICPGLYQQLRWPRSQAIGSSRVV